MKLRRLNKAMLTLDDGSSIEVERIGKGRYTTAWRNHNAVYLQVREGDASKEIMRNLSDCKTPHIPETKYLGEIGECSIYRQPFYRKLTAKDTPRAWQQFKKLSALREEAWKEASANKGYRDRVSGAAVAQAFAAKVEESDLPDTIKETVRTLADECSNYGEYTFEFRRGNMATLRDRDELILLDPIFDLADIQREQERKFKELRKEHAPVRYYVPIHFTTSRGARFKAIPRQATTEGGSRAIMKRWIVRRETCESVLIEAETETEAMELASAQKEWDSSGVTMDAEEETN